MHYQSFRLISSANFTVYKAVASDYRWGCLPGSQDFIDVDQAVLYEVLLAANYLDMKCVSSTALRSSSCSLFFGKVVSSGFQRALRQLACLIQWVISS